MSGADDMVYMEYRSAKPQHPLFKLRRQHWKHFDCNHYILSYQYCYLCGTNWYYQAFIIQLPERANFSNYIVKPSYHLIYTYKWYKSSLFACTRPALWVLASLYTCYKLSVSECYVLADACQSSRKGINRKVNGTMTLQRQIMGIFTVYLLFGTVALVVLLLLQTATDSSLRQRRRKSVRTTAVSGLTKFVCCWKFVFTA